MFVGKDLLVQGLICHLNVSGLIVRPLHRSSSLSSHARVSRIICAKGELR